MTPQERLAKIQKVEKLANDPAASPGERDNALRMAAELHRGMPKKRRHRRASLPPNFSFPYSMPPHGASIPTPAPKPQVVTMPTMPPPVVHFSIELPTLGEALVLGLLSYGIYRGFKEINATLDARGKRPRSRRRPSRHRW
jgi:hypothetical protein